jgi:hypothetical protein
MPVQIALIVVVVVLVVVVGAYALGTYLRRKQDDHPAEALPLPRRPAARKPGPPGDPAEHEVRVVVNWLLVQAFEQTGIRVADDRLAYDRIVSAAQKAVEELKKQAAAEISLPFLTADASGPKHLEARLTREMIAELVKY